MSGLRVGLTYNLRRDYVPRPGDPQDAAGELDNESTIDLLAAAIEGLGHTTVRLGYGPRLLERLLGEQRGEIDLVFNIAEGLRGRSRESEVPAVLEMLGIPYTFSDPVTMGIALDKHLTKQIVSLADVPTPRWMVASSASDLDGWNAFPAFVKPAWEGTAKGIGNDSRVNDAAALRRLVGRLTVLYRQPVLVEEYLPGGEYTVGVLGNSPPRSIGVLQISHVGVSTNDICSFDAKERCEQLLRYEKPRSTPPEVIRRMEVISLNAYRALGCRDVARVDLRCDARGEPFFLEVNPLPGMHPTHSDLPMLAEANGMSYPELVGGIIDAARKRYGV